MDQNGPDDAGDPKEQGGSGVTGTAADGSAAPAGELQLGALVAVDWPGHPHNRKRGKVVGRRGEYEPGNHWYMVLMDLDRRCYLFTRAMLRQLDERDHPEGGKLWGS